MTLSKTAAIRKSAGYVEIRKDSEGWAVVGPTHPYRPDGLRTERRATNYKDARLAATIWRAYIALHYMGRDSVSAGFFAMKRDPDTKHDLSTMIDWGLDYSHPQTPYPF